MPIADPILMPTATEWRDDLYYMAREMEQHHKNLYHTISRAQFARQVRELHEQIPALARHQIIVALARLVATVGDAHTMLYLRSYDPVVGFHRYPLDLWLLDDTLFVRAATPAYAQALGAPVRRIGRRAVAEALDRVRDLISAENPLRALVWGPALLVVPEVLHACGITDSPDAGSLQVEIDGALLTLRPAAVPDSAALSTVDAADCAPGPRPLWLRDPDNAFWFEYLPDSRTLYLQYNSVRDKPGETLAAFFGRVFAFVAAHPVARFVIDLRWNGGGNNRLNEPLIAGLVQADQINQPGRLFTIIGRRTFSAAMNCANALEQRTQTLFVGEPTGTSPNHYGDAAPVVLPHSGLSVRTATLYWEDAPGDIRPWIAPDLPVALTRDDYLAGRDPVLQAILDYEPPTAGPVNSEQ